jgi:hypothetical protein
MCILLKKLDYGCNGEAVTNHRWYPGGISYFLYNGIIIKDISAGSRHMVALDCKLKLKFNCFFYNKNKNI